MKKRDKNFAFTLAEVLITITIIGVVATMTIPTLLTNVTERQFRAGHNTFQRKMGEALKIMNIEGTLGGYTDTETFVTELSKHIKVLKTCNFNKLTECFHEKFIYNNEEYEVSTLQKSSNLGMKWETDTNVMGVQFGNGVSALLAYNTKCPANQFNYELIKITSEDSTSKTNSIVRFEDPQQCVSIIYDVNSETKPNTVANAGDPKHDIGLVNVNLKKSSCKGELITDSDDKKYCYITTYTAINTCNDDTYDTHGTSNQHCSTNYWAGAKKACIESGGKLLDEETLSSLFLKNKLNISGSFWTSSEHENISAAYYVFGVNVQGAYKNDSGVKALCVEN